MIRRPAAPAGILKRPSRRLRRPAAAIEVEDGEEAGEEQRPREEDVKEKYKRGELVDAFHIAPGGYSKGEWLLINEAVYYQQKVALAVKVEKEELEEGKRELRCLLTGTKSEELLRFGTAQRPPFIRLHLCQATCPQLRENPDLVHVRKVRKIKPEDPKTWENNLLDEGENTALQAEEAEWRRKEAEKKKKEDKSSSSASTKKKKKKKKKAKKKAREEKGERASPERTRIGGRASAKKTLQALYAGTGLDPKVSHRRKLSKKVKKALKKNRESTSSTSSSSSATTSEQEADMLLEDRSKVHRIASLGPGLLAALSVVQMKQFLTQVAGTGWEQDEGTLPPICSLYNRTYMATRLTGGVAREFSTLAWVGDLLLQARPSEALDVVLQRMKSIELTAAGTSWSTAQKLELVPPTDAQIGTRQEYQIARREAKLDSDVKGTYGGAEKGKSKGKEKSQKGKEKGKGKQKEGEGKKSG